jgi:hypothetical protein
MAFESPVLNSNSGSLDEPYVPPPVVTRSTNDVLTC